MDLSDIKILETREFEVEIYNQIIEVCSVDTKYFGWKAVVECPEDSRESIRVLLDLSKIDGKTIVHEAAHVALYICKRTLMDFTYDNNEHYCYLLGYVWEKLVDIIDEMHQKQEKPKNKKRK